MLPHQKGPMETLEDLEEERRLFYVAITRAKQLLYLSYASSQTAASGGMYGARRSAFLDDLPPEHVVYESRRKEISGRDSDSYYDPSLEKIACELRDVGLRLKTGPERLTIRFLVPGSLNGLTEKGDKAVATVDFFGTGVKKILVSFFAD